MMHRTDIVAKFTGEEEAFRACHKELKKFLKTRQLMIAARNPAVGSTEFQVGVFANVPHIAEANVEAELILEFFGFKVVAEDGKPVEPPAAE
jgi:hypothetical protein